MTYIKGELSLLILLKVKIVKKVILLFHLMFYPRVKPVISEHFAKGAGFFIGGTLNH